MILHKIMNHSEYPKSLKKKSDESLRFIICDCRLAIEINKDNPNSGYYADEISYCVMELKRRKDKAAIGRLQSTNQGNK